jgi:hypothetical protein
MIIKHGQPPKGRHRLEHRAAIDEIDPGRKSADLSVQKEPVMIRIRVCLLAFVTLASTATSLSILAGGVISAQPVFLPGGTVEPEGKIGYVTNPDGGIDAVNLQTGELLWDTKEANRPLVAFQQKLVAWSALPGKANSIRIAVFDGKGKRLLQSDPVVFPEWASVGLTYGRSFSARAEIAKGSLLLHWEAHAFYAGGAPPPPEVVRAAKKDANGTARVNLESGKVEMLKAVVPADLELPKELRKVTSRQYWTGSSWETKPLRVGDTLAALEQQALPGGKQKLVLLRWDLKTGKALEPVVLLLGKELWPRIQPDHRYVFVHQALVKEQLPPGDYAWWIFSLETGRQVGKVPFDAAGQEMSVIGPRLYTVVAVAGKRPPGFSATQPRALRAVDLRSGKTLWERAIEPQRRLLPLP